MIRKKEHGSLTITSLEHTIKMNNAIDSLSLFFAACLAMIRRQISIVALNYTYNEIQK